MQRRGLLLSIVLLAIICAGISWQVSKQRREEPMFQGKRVSAWVERAVKTDGDDYELRRDAQKIGPPAVPYLIKALHTKDKTFGAIVRWLRRRGLRFLRERIVKIQTPELVRMKAATIL